jgi:hypothetical protein
LDAAAGAGAMSEAVGGGTLALSGIGTAAEIAFSDWAKALPE